MKTLKELNELWNDLGDIPTNEDGETEEEFLDFPRGTDRFDIWHWFEEQNKDFIVGKKMEGKI